MVKSKPRKYADCHKIINNIEYKECNHCKEWFPCTDEYFYKAKNKTDGLRPDCINCTKKKQLEWKYNNYERYMENLKRYYSTEKGKESKRKELNKLVKEGKIKDWQRRNKDKIRNYNKRRKMHKKHEIGKKEWIECKKYFDNKCAYCGIPVEKHFKQWNGSYKKIDLHKEHVDHKGSNNLSNCVPSCQSCNSKKRELSLEEFYNKDNADFTEQRINRIYKWLNSDYKLYIENKKIS